MKLWSPLMWYLVLQGFALAGLPLSLAWLRRLPSRGYAVAKALGLLLSGVILWWGGILHLWPNTAAAALAAAALLFGCGLLALRGHWRELPSWWAQHRRFVVVTELLFAVLFAAWAAVRATQPQIVTAGGEKWMEIAFLNAVLRSPTLPPHDPWLSGFAISYYYLGYLLLGMVTQVAAIPATVAFNLGNAAWFALAGIMAYSIVYDLTSGTRVVKALFAPLLLLLTGNANGFLQVIHGLGLLPASFWRWLDLKSLATPPVDTGWMTASRFDWWQASRVLHDYAPIGTAQNPISQEVIDEFPAFSFILGDMHPHLLALPFVLLVIALALNLWKSSPSAPSEAENYPSLRSRLVSLLPWLGVAIALGALGFLNTWDFPIYWALVVAVMLLKRHQGAPEKTLLDNVLALTPAALGLALVSVMLYAPFWFALRSQAGGILPNVFNATHLPQFLVMFSPLAVPLVCLVLELGKAAEVRWMRVLGWSALILVLLTAAGLLVGWAVGSPYLTAVRQGQSISGVGVVEMDSILNALITRLLNPWTAFMLACGCIALFLALLAPKYELRADQSFVGLLVLLGLGLTLAPEYVFLKDVFNTRMNTIFKFYFQAWVVWSLAAAWWLSQGQPAAAGWLKRVAKVSAWLLIVVGWIYTGYAIPARAGQNASLYGGAGTLDGALWLQQRHPDDWDAISWLNTHVEGRPVIVEVPGDRYRAYVYEGRVSAFTGLPALLGWGGHQSQWRGNYDEPALREAAFEMLFTTTDVTQLRSILVQYDVAYIYIGPEERDRYPGEDWEEFAALFPVVYQNPGVTIYQVTAP
ncbi:MAG: hypothetical protein JW892_09925 [Anaerolineae bacterium]|nr:hypothetical protein [Anaerolineae bacterium]